MKYSTLSNLVLAGLLGSVSAKSVLKRADNGQQNNLPNSPSTTSSSSSSTSSDSAKTNLEYKLIEFSNFGYSGYYYNVEELDESDECSCKLSTKETKFSGSNAPVNQEVSVHFRGPLNLHKFAFYTLDNYVLGDDVSANWTRQSYYDSSSQTLDNVTFLTAAGTNSSCLGKLLTYADSDGLSELSESTILADDTLINSDEEFIIFSNVSCGSSGYKKDCGVYRSGIPLYHGFYGDTKMFLFEFELPTEDVLSKKSVPYYYDMPLIWLLNAHIPRTAQYNSNGNCSCWESGCGEFDIFEVLNSSETTHFYSTIHDYQGTGDIYTGLSAYGWIERDTEDVMRGGVVFDSNGTAVVFMTNSTSFDDVISGSDLQSWISEESDIVEDKLTSVASSTSSSSSSTSTSSSWAPKLSIPYHYVALFVSANVLLMWI